MSATIADYVDYAYLLHEEDPALKLDQAVAYFRTSMEGWPGFTQAMFKVFEQSWKDMTLPGIDDFTVRWVRMFGDKFRTDWQELLARFYKVSFLAPGSVSR